MIELEPDGIDVAALERVLLAGARPKLAHIIPNFQNPAGHTLSLAKRERLLELAREHDFVVFEDDPYVELRFSGGAAADDGVDGPGERRLRVIVLQDRRARYPGRLSGRPARGDRQDREARDRRLHLAEHGRPGHRQSVRALGRDRPRRSRRSRTRSHERVDALSAALRRELPEARFLAPEGGYFMWVELPRGTDVDALFNAATERGVQFVKGSDFVLEGYESSLRLAYSGVTPAEIEEGVARLADAYRAVTSATADVA